MLVREALYSTVEYHVISSFLPDVGRIETKQKRFAYGYYMKQPVQWAVNVERTRHALPARELCKPEDFC